MPGATPGTGLVGQSVLLSSGDGGELVAPSRPGRSAFTGRLLAAALALECTAASTFAIGMFAGWLGYRGFVSGVASTDSGGSSNTTSISIHTDVWLLILYLLPLVVLAGALAGSAVTAWQLARCRTVARAWRAGVSTATVAQPVLLFGGTVALMALANGEVASAFAKGGPLRSLFPLVGTAPTPTPGLEALVEHSARLEAALFLPLAVCVGMVLAVVGTSWLISVRSGATEIPDDRHSASKRLWNVLAGVTVVSALVVIPGLADGLHAAPGAWWVPIGPYGPSLSSLAGRFSSFTVTATGRLEYAPAVACSGPGRCIVLGESSVPGVGDWVLAAVAGESGQRWSVRPLDIASYAAAYHDSRLGPLDPALFGAGMACPTRLVCYVAGAASGGAVPVSRSDDGGKTWSFVGTALRGAPGGLIDEISCMDAMSCVVAASTGIAITHDGGATWTVVEAFQNAGARTQVDCAAASHCVVIYTRQILPSAAEPNPSLEAIATFTVDGGRSWSIGKLPVPPTTLVPTLSCPTVAHCVYTGGVEHPGGGRVSLVNTNDGGSSWHSAPASKALDYSESLACPSVRDCYLVAMSEESRAMTIEGTSDGGLTWHLELSLPGTSDISSIACPSIGDCVVAATTFPTAIGLRGNDTEALILTTIDGGTTWRRIAFPSLAS